MATTTIQYNPQNSVVLTCLDFLSTLNDVKIFGEDLHSDRTSAQEEKRLFFAGSKKSMSKHFEKYL